MEVGTRQLIKYILGAFAVLVCIALGIKYWPSIADPLAMLSAGLQAAIMVIGVVMALHDDWAKKHRSLVIGAFLVMGIAGLAVTIAQTNTAGKAAGTLATTLEGIQTSSKETARLQELNTQLQSRLLTQSKALASLAGKTVDEITGGNSFAYLDFISLEKGGGIPGVIHQGNAALSSLQFTVVDLSKPINTNVTPGQFLSQRTTYEVGKLGRNKMWTNPGIVIPFSSSEQQSFNIFFQTDYREWNEHLLVYRISPGKWARAFSVFAENTNNTLLLRCVHKDFPIEKLDSGPWTRFGCQGDGWR